MKRILALLLALLLSLSLCACTGGTTEQPAAVSQPMETPEAPADTPTPAPAVVTPDPPSGEPDEAGDPVLSPGAAEDSLLSGAVQEGPDGTVYTTLLPAEGLVYLPDLLPEDPGFVSAFLLTDQHIYAAVRDDFYSLEPAQLYRFPLGGGDGELITDDLVPDGVFCLSGTDIFYQTYVDAGLWRYDIATGTAEKISGEAVSLLYAEGGFLYYAKADGVYRNDSTMSAEGRLFVSGAVNRFFAQDTGLCDLVQPDSVSVLEFRAPDGTLRSQVSFDELTDNILCHDGKVYVPQLNAGLILVYDLASGEALEPLTLSQAGGYCLLHFASDTALYYETFTENGFSLFRLALDGSGTEYIGEIMR